MDSKKDPRPSLLLRTDPVVEAEKVHIDRTLLRENLRHTPAERVANLIAHQRLAAEARRRRPRRTSRK